MAGHACLCCGFLTLSEPPPGTYEVCPVCYWEDDPVQAKEPDYAGGANDVSLNEARRNYRQLGAVEARFRSKVRLPLNDETPRSP